MTTLVGQQEKFSNAIKALLELDFDAIEAYTVAVSRLKTEEFKLQLNEFKQDHENHIAQLTQLLNTHNEPVPTGPDVKQWLTKGKVILATLMGDKAILKAMISNENDTNQAYENVLAHPEKWEDAVSFLNQGLADEKRHKQSLEHMLNMQI